MLHRNILRLVIALALSLLVLSLFSGIYGDGPKQLFQTVQHGLGLDDVGTNAYEADVLRDLRAPLQKLRDGNPDFHWEEWLDLDKVALFETKDLSKKLYPYLSRLSGNQEPPMPCETRLAPEEQAMIGRIYCKKHLTSPFRVVELMDPAADNTSSLRLAQTSHYRAAHPSRERQHRQFMHPEPTEYYAPGEPVCGDLKDPNAPIENVIFPHVDASLFSWHPAEITSELAEGVYNHAYTVDQAQKSVDGSLKYFHELFLEDDPVGYGVHYDWRFFRGILVHEEHVAATHHLARAWQQFAEQMGIVYWYAHGSLLGYHWDGLTMPWDTDHDIQMPVAELNRLARDFNRTLVVAARSEGQHKYLIDVGPAFVERRRGNGQNVIDARFIDADTGVYIDITGLAKPTDSSTNAACKNRHIYHVAAFSRIHRTLFEGFTALVPLSYEKMLRKEYRSYAKDRFRRWAFNPKTRLWEFKQTCKDYLSTFSSSKHVFCVPRLFEDKENCGEKYGTCDQYVIKSFNESQVATAKHVRESELIGSVGDPVKVSDWKKKASEMKELAEITFSYIPPFREESNLELEDVSAP